MSPYNKPQPPIRRCGKSLKIDDVIFALGGSHPITAISEHPGLEVGGKICPARIIWSGRWCMTAFDDEMFDVAR